MSAPADLVGGVFGARGSGKSYLVRSFIKDTEPARLVVVDPMDEYGELAERVVSLAELGKRTAADSFRLRYVPSILNVPHEKRIERFGALCELVAVRGKLVLVVEEAQLFTRASAAPPEWSNLTLRGRHYGIRIFCVSQRPAAIDKDLFSNATFIRTGRLNFQDDITTMANALRVPAPAVAGLVGHEWIARDLLTGELSCEPEDAWRRHIAPGTTPARRELVGGNLERSLATIDATAARAGGQEVKKSSPGKKKSTRRPKRA